MSKTKSIPSVEAVNQRVLAVHDVLGFNHVDTTPPGRPIISGKTTGRIEHTLLKAGASFADVDRLCKEATKYGFRSVCCLPGDVARCKRILKGTDVLVVTVIDFPLAGGTTGDVTTQCAHAIEQGADEVDVVQNIRAIRMDDLHAARDKVASVVWAAGAKRVKVILETGLLSFDQIVDSCAVIEAGGAHFVKTCTGFGPRGAFLDDIHIMRRAVGDRLGIKASGGIKNRETADAMIEAGADLLGTSSGPECI